MTIEITRKIGAFDEWVEVTKANKHMEETINSIANNIQYGIPVPQTQPTQQKTESGVAEMIGTIIGLLLVVGGFLWVWSLIKQ